MAESDKAQTERADISVLAAPHLLGVFIALAATISVVPFLIGFLLGFTVASDIVFGFYALISGIAADMVLRWKPGWALVTWHRPRIPFIVVWLVFCIYIMVFQPLD